MTEYWRVPLAIGWIGFAFGDYLFLMLGMIVGVVMGSWVGNRLRARRPDIDFRLGFKWLITLLALRMILIGVQG